MFSRFILTGVWKNLMDVLSTPLTGRMAGSSKGLAFILGAEGVKEQSQRERDTICLSLDGLRKAAALSCSLGGSEHDDAGRSKVGKQSGSQSHDQQSLHLQDVLMTSQHDVNIETKRKDLCQSVSVRDSPARTDTASRSVCVLTAFVCVCVWTIRCGRQLRLSFSTDGSGVLCAGGERGEGDSRDGRRHHTRYV